ncbi:hypothetical protein GCM10009133_04180 [Cocleimonas flava]|uniref:Uncharacterized protein DUF1910 n=1 Tax=Cocleimonas flava TaxID=634765 RepID=A0A4R1F4W4_9GAMM|nr:PoNe immunity protein domain-containing protein [Cocleimonas flava]TCJ86788.1 uncharacterized protein DUF1910 [Cocleimonas flava]
MRDKLKPREWFDDILNLKQQYTHNTDKIAVYKKVNEDPTKPRNFAALTGGYTNDYIEDITYMYSRGDDLSLLEKRALEAIDRYVWVAEEIKKQGYMGKTYFYPGKLVSPHRILSLYTLLSWFICFGINKDKISKIAPFLAPESEDRLLDVVLSRFQQDRKISNISGNPETFTLLDQIIDADENKRITLVELYLKDWGKLLSNLKGLGSLGIHRQKQLTNKTLYKELEVKNATYKGFWAWEVALVVKFFDIDDTTFRDNEYYPDDLVHFKN